MTERIRKAIDEFKTENGNENFTQKEMLMYIVNRIDNLPCEKHVGLISEAHENSKTAIKMIKELKSQWKWIAGFFFTTILALVGYAIYK